MEFEQALINIGWEVAEDVLGSERLDRVRIEVRPDPDPAWPNYTVLDIKLFAVDRHNYKGHCTSIRCETSPVAGNPNYTYDAHYAWKTAAESLLDGY